MSLTLHKFNSLILIWTWYDMNKMPKGRTDSRFRLFFFRNSHSYINWSKICHCDLTEILHFMKCFAFCICKLNEKEYRKSKNSPSHSAWGCCTQNNKMYNFCHIIQFELFFHMKVQKPWIGTSFTDYCFINRPQHKDSSVLGIMRNANPFMWLLSTFVVYIVIS